MNTHALRLSQDIEAEVSKAQAAYARQDTEALYACLARLAEKTSALSEAIELETVTRYERRHEY